MIFVVNDMHGDADLVRDVVSDIEDNCRPGDIVIVNGDGAGARGPIMNEVVKLFYEVRRGETDKKELIDYISGIIIDLPDIPDEWIFDTVHAGMFRKLLADRYPRFKAILEEELATVLEETLSQLSRAVRQCDAKLVYLPGNGEITPLDLETDDITTEETINSEDRYYNRLAREGYFDKFDVEYVEYAKLLPGGVLLLSTNLLDLDKDDAKMWLGNMGVLSAPISNVVVHYPPAIAPLGKCFTFWKPNKTDVKRTEMVEFILNQLGTRCKKKSARQRGVSMLVFGHIHCGPHDPRMDPFPALMTFSISGVASVWQKPGSLLGL